MSEYKDIDEILKKLPDDLPYKASVKRVLMQAPAADVVPREMFDQLKTQLEEVRLEKAAFEGAAKQIAESCEIIRYCADLIREAAVREFAESLCEGMVENHPVVIAVKCGLKSYLENNAKECPRCKYFVGCEKANWVRGCEEYREKGDGQ